MKRREFLFAAAGAMTGLALAQSPPPPPSAVLFVHDRRAHRLVALQVPSGKTLCVRENFSATHAIQLVPRERRAFVHGHETGKPGGALIVMKVSPQGEVSLELDHELADFPLHWQPRPDLSEIVYNTTGDQGLTIVNTSTLALESFPHAAGNHSLMAFFENDVVCSNGLVDAGQVRILDRKAGYADVQCGVGPWPHGLALCQETGRAYCWCADGVHVVGVRGTERGRHLALIPPFARGQRCWFAWTPQGGRLSHDVSWCPGDVYQPYLTVIDGPAQALERIESGTRKPGTLTVSDDGALGLASSRNTQEALVFDLKSSKYVDAIATGPSDPSQFFDRDLSIAPGGRWAAVTNPSESSVSVLDLERRREVVRVPLGFPPGWMKMMLV